MTCPSTPRAFSSPAQAASAQMHRWCGNQNSSECLALKRALESDGGLIWSYLLAFVAIGVITIAHRHSPKTLIVAVTVIGIGGALADFTENALLQLWLDPATAHWPLLPPDYWLAISDPIRVMEYVRVATVTKWTLLLIAFWGDIALLGGTWRRRLRRQSEESAQAGQVKPTGEGDVVLKN